VGVYTDGFTVCRRIMVTRVRRKNNQGSDAPRRSAVIAGAASRPTRPRILSGGNGSLVAPDEQRRFGAGLHSGPPGDGGGARCILGVIVGALGTRGS